MFYFAFVCTILSFFLPITALPAPFERRGITTSLLQQFALYEQYSAAAYCKDNNDNNPGSLNCACGSCPLVQQSGIRSILEFSNVGVTDVTGFVAVDDVNKVIVLAYRGSVSLGNWIGNVNLGFNDFSGCAGCKVHAGFLSSYNDSRDQILNALSQAKTQNPSYSIVFTGHSLGAAISTIAAADLRQKGFNAALYTYGSPMVGNDAFANFVTKQGGGNYRITHAYDAVPKLPGYLLNYRHVSPEYWATTPSGQPFQIGDVKMSSGILNLFGNQGTFQATINDHLWYFNQVAGCTGGFEL